MDELPASDGPAVVWNDPGDDESSLPSPATPVFLATINLERSEALSRPTAISFLGRWFPVNARLVKHWGIVVRDTLYELGRDDASVKLMLTNWSESRDRHDPLEQIGSTTLDDDAVLAIAQARFSRWPKHGYSVTFSNCQCFCYRFAWYVCDETRFRRGELASSNLPPRLALVQAYLFCVCACVMGVGWAVWQRHLWWPFGWDTLVGVVYECGVLFMLRALYTGREYLGGWEPSEQRLLQPMHANHLHDAGIGLARSWAYGPPYFRGFVKQIRTLCYNQRPTD